jgi:hypothetical protein
MFYSVCVCDTRNDSYPAFSSSSSFEPEPVFVGRSSSGIILELLLLPSIVVSANLFVCAIFSIILPPAVRSDILCFLAARCFFALVRSAYMSWSQNNIRRKCFRKINHKYDAVGRLVYRNNFYYSRLKKEKYFYFFFPFRPCS